MLLNNPAIALSFFVTLFLLQPGTLSTSTSTTIPQILDNNTRTTNSQNITEENYPVSQILDNIETTDSGNHDILEGNYSVSPLPKVNNSLAARSAIAPKNRSIVNETGKEEEVREKSTPDKPTFLPQNTTTAVSQGASDKPQSQGTSDKVQSQAASDKPQSQEASDKPQSQAASDKLQSQAASDKPQSQEASDKPQSQEARDKLQSQGTSDKPQSQGTSDKPQNQGTSDKPQNQGTSDKLKSQAASDKLKSQEARDKLQSVGDAVTDESSGTSQSSTLKTLKAGARHEPISKASAAKTAPHKSGSHKTKLVTAIAASHLPVSTLSSLSPPKAKSMKSSSPPPLLPVSTLSSSLSPSRATSASSSPLPASTSPSLSPSSSLMPTTSTISPGTTKTGQTFVEATPPQIALLRAKVSTTSTTRGKPSTSSAIKSQTDSTPIPPLPQEVNRAKTASPAGVKAGGKKKEEGLTGAKTSPPSTLKAQSQDKALDVQAQPLKASYEDLAAANKTTKKNTKNDDGKLKKKKTSNALESQDSLGPQAPKGAPGSSGDCAKCDSQGSSPALRYQAAVSAVLTNHFGPDKDVIVPFDLELVDLADNYDNESGVFFCSIPGTYVISVHLMSHPGSKVNARIFINSRPVAALWADDNKNGGFYPSSSIQTISRLEFGDQVYVMLVDGGYGDSWVHANYNVFTIFLLYEDFLGS